MSDCEIATVYKLDLGPTVAMAPDCYKRFISAHRDRFEGAITRNAVNEILAETDSRAVLRRKRLGTPRRIFNVTTLRSELVNRGDWYLEFKSKRDYTAFVLRWS